MGRKRLYEVEIKSGALIDIGKKGFVTYFEGGQKKTIVKNVLKLYPQFTQPEHKPIVNITPITYEEYEKRQEDGIVRQKQVLVSGRGHLLGEKNYETLAD